MKEVKEFECELSNLLNKYGYSLICESQNNENDWSVQIGVQDEKGCNKWYGRHHVTGFDIK